MTALRFEIRKFNGSSFMEGYEKAYGESIEDFEDFVGQFTDTPEEENGRPFSGIIAARQWIDHEGQQISAFAYKNN